MNFGNSGRLSFEANQFCICFGVLQIAFEIQILYYRYDAVTEEGRLNWQNCLNEKNCFFFGDSDGLFTNYSWRVGLYMGFRQDIFHA